MILLPILLFVTVSASDWAVIVAGSSGYWNYRHQAAAASAYRYYLRRGIPKQQIITFMSGSIAKDELNPFFNKLYSAPGNITNNKMDGIEIDYGSAEITATKVLNVLSGNSFSSKRVLRSSAIDNVYVSFFTYGAPGVILLPKEALFGSDLMKVIELMYQKRLYKELVLYIDGEGTDYLFPGFDLDLYHVRLVSPFTEKLMNRNLFCPPDDIVGGKSIGSCMNTEFSYRLYDGGNSVFHSPKPELDPFSNENIAGQMNVGYNGHEWSVYDTKFEYYVQRLARDPKNVDLRRDMQEEDNTRSQIEQYIRTLSSVRKVGKSLVQISEWDCYKRGVKRMEKLFFWNEYTFRFFTVIASICEQNKQSF